MAKRKREEVEEVQEDESSSGGSIAVNDAWTGMLVISLLALMIGAGFLYYDYQSYDEDVTKVKVPKLTGSPPGTPPKVDAPAPPKEPEKKDDKKDPEKKDGMP